jgi:acyl-CoA thioesterase-2
MNAIDRLIRLLELEPEGSGRFRGHSPRGRKHRIFGGQVVAQALVAAARTGGALCPHSIHAYFLRPGDPAEPIRFEVEEIRTGRRFGTRGVAASQDGRPILRAMVSLHQPEPGFDHQDPMLEAPPPETVPSTESQVRDIESRLPEAYRKLDLAERPIELRPVAPTDPFAPDKREPRQLVWLRATGPMPDDPLVHQAVLAHASDMTLLGTCLRPHGVSWLSPELESASLDHAIWFHRPFRADEWLLYAQESPSAAGALGLNRGSLFTREGVLVATVTQEALVRIRPEPSPL